MSSLFVMFWIFLALLMQPGVQVILFVIIGFLVLRWWFGDAVSIRRRLGKRRSIAQLRATLEVNPHHRDARHELAELLVERKRYEEALGLAQQNLDAGDDNLETKFLAGVAALGTGRDDAVAQGEALLGEVESEKRGYRTGAVPLELGRAYLELGRLEDARASLERAIESRPGSVEARVLLATCLERSNDPDGARRLKDEAWTLHKGAPRFEQRRNRLWAWRANPIAAVRAIALVVVPIVVLIAAAVLYESPDSTGWDDFSGESYE